MHNFSFQERTLLLLPSIASSSSEALLLKSRLPAMSFDLHVSTRLDGSGLLETLSWNNDVLGPGVISLCSWHRRFSDTARINMYATRVTYSWWCVCVCVVIIAFLCATCMFSVQLQEYEHVDKPDAGPPSSLRVRPPQCVVWNHELCWSCNACKRCMQQMMRRDHHASPSHHLSVLFGNEGAAFPNKRHTSPERVIAS